MLFNLHFLSPLDCQLKRTLPRQSFSLWAHSPVSSTSHWSLSLSLSSAANPFLLSSLPPTQSLSILISLPHLFSLSFIHTPLSVPSNLSPPLAPPLSGSQDSIIYSSLMLCMIWAIDEAISLSPLLALPSLSLSPCCLMFQFGGSKHSIRQINCLMHVISQTVYERGAPRPGAASPPQQPLRPSHSPALHAHTVYSHIDRPIQARASTRGHLCTHTHTHTYRNTHIYTCTDSCKHRHIDERLVSIHAWWGQS